MNGVDGREAGMRHTQVRDVMTTDVVSVGEATPYKEIVETLARRRISGVPVVDRDRHPVGIVSETDLLAKEADPVAMTERPLLERPRHRSARRKAAAEDARSLMTPRPVTITADEPVAEAARRMRRHGINRLPVVDGDGRLVGIVSRGDVLGVFLRSDEEILRSIREDLFGDWWMDPDGFLIEVRDGAVAISGELEQEGLVGPLRRAVASVDGVVSVDDLFTWRLSAREARRPADSSLPW
jgi:CBS domain-containing protein